MELSFSLELGGWFVAIVGALLFGIVAQLIGRANHGYEWFIDGVAAFVGAIVASEFIVAWQTFEPVYQGLALVPALAGGLVVGVIIAVATRWLGGRSYGHSPAAA
jgi:uncharacterized membrane protein YeaQ/YmgE (transglycosylase-associated protein family)